MIAILCAREFGINQQYRSEIRAHIAMNNMYSFPYIVTVLEILDAQLYPIDKVYDEHRLDVTNEFSSYDFRLCAFYTYYMS